MRDRTFKMTKIVGESTDSIESAAGTALKTSGMTVRGHDWAHLVDIRANLNEDGSVDRWQVTLEVAFEIEQSG